MDTRVVRQVEDGDGDVVGWGERRAAWAAADAPSVARSIFLALHAAGVREAFGVIGGGIAPLAAGLANTPIRFYHFRHEAGAGFSAIESWFATGRPAVVAVTTGPGLFNVLNAAMAARVDGAKLLVVSGFTSRSQQGRGAVQETSAASMPADVTRAGSIFHDVFVPESEDELAGALGRIVRGLTAPGGYVAHLGLPLSLQGKLLPTPRPLGAAWRFDPPAPTRGAVDACLDALRDPGAAIWVGHGALAARDDLLRFAEAAHLPVITSPRAKGLFPESHPLFIGVSGAGGGAEVQQWFRARRPRHVLVVGTRLGEVTSFLAPGLAPSERWTHVDIDPAAFGAAYPEVPGRGIVADAAQFFAALHARAGETGWYARREPIALPERHAEPPLPPRSRGDVRPSYLLQAIQARIVDATDALVMSEAGNAFTWCNARLRFDRPGRYRTSAAWGSMGHFTTGCVGAALAGDRRVVAVVGDGAMLMNNEINTAAQYGARVLWIVLNDAQLGLNHHGMLALGMRPLETQMPRTDFVAFARSQGVDGLAVLAEPELDAALDRALAHDGPFVLDVRIDPTVPSPILAARTRSLESQTSKGAA
ncbi:thiamine pyrophosphate-binding protein [Nannocystis pusilla]|uniref:Thiamine pyrophosphate-binding protein n=1 Tax=Nannocystis pusilla TaxID=889268 RepID=A0ABS7TLP2_9BACT|nr:thiamine pyrophosphate-dependent enzyme [Nannocystis pusilla]MBZ5709139.1 thiamine pyrophosphate-binding protein [Nannocystis pusilla]